MIDLFLLLVFIACLGIVAAWLAENPGSVTIHWFDYRIDTSFAFLLLLALIAAALLVFIYSLVHRLMRAPKRHAERRELKHHRQGLTEITHSVAALAAADIAGAESHIRKAEKFLGKGPLVLLLSAQVAKSRGDDEKTRLMLEQMLDHKETEYLAARSLSDAAGRKKLFPKALALAERAMALNPKETGSLASVVGLHVRLGQWQEAMHAIGRVTRKGHVKRADIRRLPRSIVHLAQRWTAGGWPPGSRKRRWPRPVPLSRSCRILCLPRCLPPGHSSQPVNRARPPTCCSRHGKNRRIRS